MKVAAVTPIPTPYRDPFWNEVAAQQGVDLHVYYCAGGKADRPWSQLWELRFRYEILKSLNLAKPFGPGSSCYWSPGLLRRLSSEKYDAIIVGGYNHLTMLGAILWAQRAEVPYFLMNEVYLAQPRKWWRRVVKVALVRRVVRHAAGFFPTGTLAAGYLKHYGAPAEKMWHIPNAPDVDAIHRRARELASQRYALQTMHRLNGAPVVLFVGRLIGLKQVDLLLRAFQEVTRASSATALIIGDGPIRPQLESTARQLGIGHSVRFLGFLDPQQLHAWYAMADLLVLPSSDETWSVVVLEALASGVPAVVTNRVGCYADVVNSPVVGDVVPACDQAALAAAISRRIANPLSREDVWKAWAPVREGLRYGVLARRMVDVLRTTCNLGRPMPARNPKAS